GQNLETLAVAEFSNQLASEALELVRTDGGDTFRVKKPDPAHIIRTAEMVGVGGTTIMVGDSINDIEAARRANVPSVGVTFGYSDVPMAELRPDVMIGRFSELPEAIARCSS
ncbi:MAG: HAD-IA family hydrolase, partial [Pseudomonadota bacterium]